jgi:hypothetical protein
MKLQIENNRKTLESIPFSIPISREQIKQELRRRIDEALQAAKDLKPDECISLIRERLKAIQRYCETVDKVFIMIEENITCDRYDLGGSSENTATLFRGPREDASVAICITHKGSLLHRNSSPWRTYKQAGDVNPNLE